jgi:hypothetical protein
MNGVGALAAVADEDRFAMAGVGVPPHRSVGQGNVVRPFHYYLLSDNACRLVISLDNTMTRMLRKMECIYALDYGWQHKSNFFKINFRNGSAHCRIL